MAEVEEKKKPRTAPWMMTEAEVEVTLDEFMRRDPAGMDDRAFDRLIRVLRADRARFTKKEQDKKAKGAAVEDDDD